MTNFDSETTSRDIYLPADIIRHALTGGHGRVYRRHYVVSRGAPNHDVLERMVTDGLMEMSNDGEMLIGYRVTAKGAASIGLHLPESKQPAPEHERGLRP